MSQARIRGKLLERYATVIALLILFFLSYSFWTWGRVGRGSSAVVKSKSTAAQGQQEIHVADKGEQKSPDLLALPQPDADSQSDDGFIPVPEDGAVPAGSSVRLDMSTGKKTYKPPRAPQVIDDVRDHRDYVDMSALRELHKRTGGVPKEPTKWKQQFKGVRKQIEDLLISLKRNMSLETALKTLEQLEDYVISAMSNAGGIFHSDYFLNLVHMLEHEMPQVRLATASLMFYSVQNNQLTSDSFLGNEIAVSIFARVLYSERDVPVLYKCISILDSALAVCAEGEHFQSLTTNLNGVDMFTIMNNKIESLGSTAGPEKILSTLALVAQKTEDGPCMQLLEAAVGKTINVPKTMITKIVAPLCPRVDVNKHPKLHKQCRGH